MSTRLARLGFLIVALLVVGSTTASAKEPEEIWKDLNKLSGDERQKHLVSKAKEEGEVVLYTTLTAELIEPLQEDFERRYVGVKLTIWRGGGESVSNRILTEARARKFSVDVVSGSNEHLPTIRKGGLVGRYNSPESEFYAYPNKDRDGYWTTIQNILAVIAYNPRLVSRSEAPSKYEDFLDPKWKGHFAIDTNPDRAVMVWLKIWGHEKTERFLQGLIKNGVAVRRGHTLMAQLLCAGEFKAAIELYASALLLLKQKGCPVEMVFPNPTPGAVAPLYIARYSPHPHAAALLLDYLLSESAQQILVQRARISGRIGIKPAFSELDLENRGVGSLLLKPEDVEELATKYFELRERYLLTR